MRIITKNEKETAALAKKIAARLKGGEVLALVGELGSGKTTFTQALAKALGVKARVSSPTFTILKVYRAGHAAIKSLVHIDAYRLRRAADLAALGWDDYLRADSVAVVEWADRVKRALPRRASTIRFQTVGKNKRRISCALTSKFFQRQSGQS